MKEAEWSVVTVTMAEHLDYLELIREFLIKSNFSRWYIINNDPKLNLADFRHPRIEVIKGPVNEFKDNPYGAGIHHSQGLALGLAQVKTQWTIILDPDFFIVNWELIPKIISEANNKNFHIVATTWFPIWIGKRINCLTLHFAICKTQIFTKDFEWYPKNLIDSKKIDSKKRKRFITDFKNLHPVNFI
jgi:hypothetical protein